MPKSYQHLTRDQRCQIATLKASGFLQNDIAKRLGVSPSTLSRELRRNSLNGEYLFIDANMAAASRDYGSISKTKMYA